MYFPAPGNFRYGESVYHWEPERMRLSRTTLTTATVCMGLILGGCSTNERGKALNESLARASLSIDVARATPAQTYAAGELAIAEEKLLAAREAAGRSEYDLSERLLAEAMINLELARAKGAAGAARSRAGETPGG